MKSTWLISAVVCSAGLLMVGCDSRGQAVADGRADEAAIDLNLQKAPKLPVELLVAPAMDVRPEGPWLCPNPDGKTYDVLWWYYPSYGKKQRLVAIDLGTGKFNIMEFPDREHMHNASHEIAWDRKMYFPTTDWGQGGADGERIGVKKRVRVYDPATNSLGREPAAVVPGMAGMGTLILGPDGRMYGAGRCYRSDPGVEQRWDRAGVYAFDPASGEVQNYGPVGPSHDPHGAFGYFIGVCDQYIYVADGKIPWYLVAVNIATGEDKVLMEVPTGDYDRMRIFPMAGGARAKIKRSADAEPEEYWLYHGKAIPKTSDQPPWTKIPMPSDTIAPEPQLYSGQIDPGPDGMAAVWFRTAEAAAAAPDPAPKDATAEDLGWRRVKYGPVNKSPVRVHRLMALGDGRIFGTAWGYVGRFLFDPTTGKATTLGRGGPSIYCLTEFERKIYWSGYANAPVDVLDPQKPWTLAKGGPPGQGPPPIQSAASNPRRIVKLFDKTRVKKMHAAAVGADGRIYFGGSGHRDYSGGGLGWIDPKNDQAGGVWKPFSGYEIHLLEPVNNGRLLAIGTRPGADELNDNRVAESGKLFFYDVGEGRIVSEVVPVVGQAKSGPVLEVAPGRLMGLTDDPADPNGSILYGIDVAAAKVVFRKKLPGRLGFLWSQSMSQYDFVKGPDGFVWTYLDNVIVRIDPTGAAVHVVGRLDKPGKMTFVGRDLYLAGLERLRRLSAIVPAH